MPTIRIIVEIKECSEIFRRLCEAATSPVADHPAFHNQPLFVGGEYHGLCELGDGRDVLWTVTGKRSYHKKFLADDKIPQNAKTAMADVLGINESVLESYMEFDIVEKRDVYILKEKPASTSGKTDNV